MNFKKWLQESDLYQSVFDFMKEEPPVKINKTKFKNKEDYVNSASKTGKKTEIAAEKIVSAPVNSWVVGEEELLELVNRATYIPASKKPPRPEFNIAIAHLKSKEILANGKSRFRILAFWEGENKIIGKNELENLNPIGGIVYIGGYITDVWVSPAFRGTDKQGFSLYKELRKFATRRGIVGLSPGDNLTSKSFRAAQAKYDYSRL